MQPDRSPLPDYENPPVVETILGVQFHPLPKFRNAHLGAFWKSLAEDEWPTVGDAPPLAPQFEQFAEPARWNAASLQLSLSRDVPVRLQITNRDGDRMIQVQNGRLHFNWLGRPGGDYPRYQRVREGFDQTFGQFLEFIDREQLGEFQANQWEVTYLNHIPKGMVWNGPEDWNFFRPLAGGCSVEGLAESESFNGEWHFTIPSQRGRLHASWQHGLRSNPEQQEVIILTLTARGPIPKSTTPVAGVLDGLDLGREVIVRSFQALMSDSANQFWGLKHADI